MAIQHGDNVEQCLLLITELLDMVDNARGTFLQAGTCVVNRDDMKQRLLQLDDILPESIHQAKMVLDAESQIRSQASQESAELLARAQAQAKKIVDDAQHQLQAAQQEVQNAQAQAQQAQQAAERTVQDAQRRAQEEGARVIQQAQAQAAGIIAQAEAEAQEKASQENVYRMAAVAADELQEKTRNELGQIRQNTFDYLDHVMAQADRCLSELLGDVRMERGEMNNHR